MAPVPLQTQDFWRVNGYGYPNYFSAGAKAQEAWATFQSFISREGGSYRELKEFWSSDAAPRRLDSAALESWKAAFEEFGLLYVISRSDAISITPAGKQFHAAALQNNQQEFIWIGLHLLFRYPIQGPPRGRRRNAAHETANILPYRFLYSAMRDLGDYFWWVELERIFCRVFQTWEAGPAVDAVRYLRANPSDLGRYPLPTNERKGAFYNSLNQVSNHAGMNHLVIIQNDESEHYGPNESKRRHLIRRDYLSLVSVALGDSTAPTECGGSAAYVDRLPTAPSFADEQSYFNYLGAAVPLYTTTIAAAAPRAVNLAGDTVFILNIGEHFEPITDSGIERTVQGKTATFCRIARNHRVILSTELGWTYLVIGKDLIGSDTVRLSLRRARPIVNFEPIQALIAGESNA